MNLSSVAEPAEQRQDSPTLPPADQMPRVWSVPKSAKSSGFEAVRIAEAADLELDPWEEWILRQSMGEDAEGHWAAFEVAVLCARQNGKNEIGLVRELAGLFVLDEGLLIHSAHEFQTAMEHFRRLRSIIEDTPQFSRRLPKGRSRGINTSNGKEGIELRDKRRIRFRARTKSSGRGLTGDLVVFDEAMDLPSAAMGALLPTISARANPQIWYLGSPADQEIHDHCSTWTVLRERGHKGDDALAWFEYGVDADSPDAVTQEMAQDRDLWKQANPALGIRITEKYVEKEQRTLDPRSFATERLGVGDWPDLTAGAETIIDLDLLRKLEDAKSKMVDPIAVGIDVAMDRSSAAIASAGRRSDGLLHVEVTEHRRNIGWLPDRLLDFARRQNPAAIVLDGRGPSFDPPAELRPEPHFVNPGEYAKACAMFFDACQEEKLRHLGQPELISAVAGAKARPLSDAWAWGRKNSKVDISPLVAVTLALWGLQTQQSAEPWVAF